MFIYELRIKDSKAKISDFHTFCQDGYWCEWAIKNYDGMVTNTVSVTDDHYAIIVYPTIAAAEAGATCFLSL
jgi:hypothetical protein